MVAAQNTSLGVYRGYLRRYSATTRAKVKPVITPSTSSPEAIMIRRALMLAA